MLRVTGVESGNAGAHTTAIDFRTLEQMPRVEVRVHEPFLKRDMDRAHNMFSSGLIAQNARDDATRLKAIATSPRIAAK